MFSTDYLAAAPLLEWKGKAEALHAQLASCEKVASSAKPLPANLLGNPREAWYSSLLGRNSHPALDGQKVASLVCDVHSKSRLRRHAVAAGSVAPFRSCQGQAYQYQIPCPEIVGLAQARDRGRRGWEHRSRHAIQQSQGSRPGLLLCHRSLSSQV